MEVATECVVKIKAARVNGCLKAKFFLFSSMFHVLNSQHVLQNEWQVSTKISGSMCCLLPSEAITSPWRSVFPAPGGSIKKEYFSQ